MHVHISPFCARMLYSTLVLACLLTMRPGFADTLIRTGGTGSAVRAISNLGAAFKQTRPGTDIVVLQGLGSGGAVKALAAHALDLGLTARPLQPVERSHPLQEVEVARSPLVFAGIKTDPGLTLAKVADIYAGRQQAWPDGRTLRLILGPEGDAETAVLRRSKPLYLVVRADAPEPVRALVSFIRFPRGVKILADPGYRPISTAGRYQARA